MPRAYILAPGVGVAWWGLPEPSGQMLIVLSALVLLAAGIGWLAWTRPRVQSRVADAYERAFSWIDRAITAWNIDGRLSDEEAERLRSELREPEFTAALPHFGVHLTIGVLLRFPFGSIARGAYVLANMALAHLRFAARRIDYPTFRNQMGIHSPLVLALSCLPGIGVFAFLASKPFRAHHLLARVALDAALLKLPSQIYERSGLRSAIARQPRDQTAAKVTNGEDEGGKPRIRIALPPVILALVLVATGLLGLDLTMQVIDRSIEPDFLGWAAFYRILDLDSESSIGTWFTGALLILCAIVLAVIAYTERQRNDVFARHWAFLALLVVGFSIDEQAQLHDLGSGVGTRMRELLGLGGLLYHGWVLIALASVLLVAYAYRHFIVALPSGIRLAFFAAAGLYVGGEVLMEMVSGWVIDRQGDSLLYLTVTSFEEYLAMIGIIIAFGALLAYVRAAIGSIVLHVMPTLAATKESAAVPLSEASRSEQQVSAASSAKGVHP
jgi:hypothetical protein